MPKIVLREEFIQRARLLHNNYYDYTLLPEVVSTNAYVNIICPEHGTYNQKLGSHLEGKKCPKCSIANKNARTLAKLLVKISAKHGTRYNYSQTKYSGPQTKSTIICSKHGPFDIRLWSHAQGDGCPLCGSGKRRTTADFVILAREVHGDRYDYSQAVYTNATTKLTIVCSQHGPFQQTPDMHCFTNTQGCPACKSSKGELLIIRTLKQLDISDVVHQKTFADLVNPNTGKLLRYDFFVPSHNLLIEYDGEAHYKPVNFSGKMSSSTTIDRLDTCQQLDKIKTEYATDNGYNLIRIPYTEFERIPEIISEELQK